MCECFSDRVCVCVYWSRKKITVYLYMYKYTHTNSGVCASIYLKKKKQLLLRPFKYDHIFSLLITEKK